MPIIPLCIPMNAVVAAFSTYLKASHVFCPCFTSVRFIRVVHQNALILRQTLLPTQKAFPHPCKETARHPLPTDSTCLQAATPHRGLSPRHAMFGRPSDLRRKSSSRIRASCNSRSIPRICRPCPCLSTKPNGHHHSGCCVHAPQTDCRHFHRTLAQGFIIRSKSGRSDFRQ